MTTYDQHLADIERFHQRGEQIVIELEMGNVLHPESTDFLVWSFSGFCEYLSTVEVLPDDYVVVNMRYYAGGDSDSLKVAELVFPKSILNIENEHEFDTKVAEFVKTLDRQL